MNIKSAIQIANEKGTVMGMFKTAVRNLNESYEVHEAVFGIINNRPYELEYGYMEVVKEFDNVDAALDNIYESNQCIYIVNPCQVFIGKHVNNLSDCSDMTNVLDISTLKMVGR